MFWVHFFLAPVIVTATVITVGAALSSLAAVLVVGRTVSTVHTTSMTNGTVVLLFFSQMSFGFITTKRKPRKQINTSGTNHDFNCGVFGQCFAAQTIVAVGFFQIPRFVADFHHLDRVFIFARSVFTSRPTEKTRD